MASLSIHEDDSSVRMTPLSNIQIGKAQSPRSPEKPPVAAKPKLAPPLPPKPKPSPKTSIVQTGISFSTACANCPKEAPVNESHKSITDNSVNGTINETSKTTESTALAGCNSTTIQKPPLPTSPPRVPNKGPLSPTTSSSLPASFRRKYFSSSALLQAQSQIQVSVELPTPPLSPPSLSPTSEPIQEIILAKVPPSTLPKPAVNNMTKLRPSHNESSSKSLEMSNTTHCAQVCDLESNKTVLEDHKSVYLLTPSCANATTEQMPPVQSEPVHLNIELATTDQDKNKLLSSSQISPCFLKHPISNIDSLLPTATPPLDMPAPRPRFDAKAVPPPLPKNPPRGNVPRKPRSLHTNTASPSEAKTVSPISEQSEIDLKEILTIQGDSVKFSVSLEATSALCDAKSGPYVKDSVSSLPEIPKTAPKPRPRTRVSSEVSKSEHSLQEDHSLKDLDVKTTFLACSDQLKDKKPVVELDYVEVYRGDAEDLNPSIHKDDTSIKGRAASKNLQINSGTCAIHDCISTKSNNEDLSDTLLNEFSEELKNEEPEATCGMLKEIEELLKTKLGGEIKLDTEFVDLALKGAEETEDCKSSTSSSPVRPPRPKHQASLDRHIGSLESLTGSIDSSSTECLSSAGLPTTGKKIPPKPKRSFMSRINRSHSDVSEIKCGDTVCSQTPLDKPYLPPRSESLRRSESLNSTNPPPLPPRNKPQATTAISAEVQSDPETVNSTSMSQDGTSDSSGQSNSSGTFMKSDKPSPRRHAPPPPSGPPKRSSTFSPGDVRLQKKEGSLQRKGKEGLHNLSSVTNHRRLSIPDSQEQVYHEISDHSRTNREESPPPNLPPRSLNADKREQRKEKKDDAGRTSSERILSPDDQKMREKRAKNALVYKVTQSLGLSKMTRKAKVVESTNDSTVPKVTTIETKVASEQEVTPKHAAEEQPSFKVNQSSALDKAGPATDTSSSFTDRRLSTISHQSSVSGEGETQAFDSRVLEETPSSDSESEPEPDKEEIYAVRKAKKVFFIAKEIMSSEHNFVDVLKLLNLDFRLHISRATEKLGQPVIPSEILNKILDLLPQLSTFNEDLLKDITERVENWNDSPKISDIFVKKGPFLKLYSTYISNFENATALLESAIKKYPTFATALKEFEMSPRCANLALKHYMLKPIQRIPQYKLLLQDYLKNLSPLSLDYKDTLTALNIVSEVADHANESMRQGDNVQNLLEIQRSLIGQFEVIQPGRVLIKKGELQKLSRKEMQPRMFILFNDVLLHTTATATGYKINNILPLTGMKVSFPKLEVYKFEFNIICVQRSFTLCASSSKEKEDWVHSLQTAIETNAKKHHTFEAFKPGPPTSLHDKDFILGSKAPLWVPDARVTMCMLCLVEFTLTWRRHHCRSCGRIVCSQCSDNKAPLRYLKNKPARVCDKCFDTLKEALEKEIEGCKEPSFSSPVSQSSDNPGSPTSVDSGDITGGMEAGGPHNKQESIQNLNDLLQRFQKIRISNRKANTPSRPSVLKEVQANDEGSDISGYLRAYKSRKWKKLWFVLKGKVLYTYKASEDMAAVESMPLLGYEVTRLNGPFEGAEADHLFELTHQNKQPVTKKFEKTIQRLIFRTDGVSDTDKWVSMLAEAAATAFT